MTDEERRQAEAVARTAFPGESVTAQTGRDLIIHGYAAACEAKRGEIEQKEEANQRLADKINGGLEEEIQQAINLYLAERARSAKLFQCARDYVSQMHHVYGGNWLPYDAPVIEAFEHAIAEYEASRD